MKRLLKPVTASSEAHEDDTNIMFSIIDLADILMQIEELTDTVAIRRYEGALQLGIGNSIYEISDVRDNQRYPRRRLRKIEP